MEVFRIEGPSRLKGEIKVQGSKNAILPMMAATVVNGAVTVLENCPDISDLHDACHILRHIGCSVTFKEGTLTVDSSGPINSRIPEDIMVRIRASFVFTGALLARCASFSVSQPGGCNIGLRPIDIHLDAMRLMGARFDLTSGEINCTAENLTPCDVPLRFPSVGATENIMILASAVSGTTRIINAAREPEIEDLQNLLNTMGAHITGAGTGVITVKGTGELRSARVSVMPDRIDTATYLSAACCTGGEIRITDACPEHIMSYINILKRCGAEIELMPSCIGISVPRRLKGGISVSTAPYPGFATDMQSLLLAALSVSDGVSLIRENIFENRFCVSNSLAAMGADIRIYRSTASVRGVKKLFSCDASVCDLRSGAALAVAMMGAEGVSNLGCIRYIDRGYERFEEKYKSLGALIERIEVEDERQ